MPDSVFEERNPVTCPFIFWWPLLRDVKTLEFWNDHSPLISSQRDFPGPSSSLSVRTLFTYLFYFFHHHLWPHTSFHLHPHPSHAITILLPVSLSSFSFFPPFFAQTLHPSPSSSLSVPFLYLIFLQYTYYCPQRYHSHGCLFTWSLFCVNSKPAGTSCVLLMATSSVLSPHVLDTVLAWCLPIEYIHQILSGQPPPHIPKTRPC